MSDYRASYRYSQRRFQRPLGYCRSRTPHTKNIIQRQWMFSDLELWRRGPWCSSSARLASSHHLFRYCPETRNKQL